MATVKPVKDNRVIKYGRLWPNKPWGPKNRIIPCPDWYIELCILRDYERMKKLPNNKLVSWPQHFVNFCKIVFGDPRGIFYFEWNPNAMRILGNFYKHNILAISGHKSCVPYETKILDPLTGKEHEIGWLCRNRIAPTVMTLEGPKQAEIPFLKGEAEIYEVTTTDGKKIRCTSQHRFLTPTGWRRLEEMKVGDSLATYDADPFLGADRAKWIPAFLNPLASNLGNGPLTQKQDVHGFPKITEDFQAHYSDDFRPCDAPLHLEAGIGQSFAPSPSGAQEHMECACDDADDLAHTPQCNHLCSQSDHPSNYSAFPSFASFFESVDHQFQSRACEEMRKRFEPLFESILQSDTCLSLPDTFEEPDHGFAHTPSSGDDHYYSFDSSLPEGLVSYTQVASIIESGKEKFYDITVPGPAHYFAQGFINHNSGKTEALALIGAMWFFLFPKDTKVIVTSTTVAAAKDKVWGKVKLVWMHLERYFGPNIMPGKLVDSQNRIRYEHNGIKSETRGIMLLASESSSEKESADKLQGTKAERMIIMGDEFATLKHSLLNTVLNNLTANKQCKLAGAFNPSSFYDPGGIISRPKGGWSTVTEDDDEWETEIEPFGLKGYCIRFDGEKSPNVVLGEERWKGLLTLEKLTQIGPIGTKTKGYYEQIRGFWSPLGDLDSIYTETEIVKYGADRPCTTWVEPPTMVAGLDPAYVHGGDRAVLTIGKCGVAVDVDTQMRQKVFELTHIYNLDEDITNKSISKSEWIVKITKEKLAEHKVDVRNFAIDATGGGEPFGALVARDIGLGFINVCFAGRASEMPVSRNDRRKGCDRFFNMASELWYVGRELIRAGQLKGLKPDVVSEMVSRTYKEKASIVQIESKKDMRLRTKKSPDCFVAGTMVATPNGERPIESIKIGDLVTTPFGTSEVVFTHETETNELTTIEYEGKQLVGKGSHKVMVWGHGWVRMDEIVIDNKLESLIVGNLWNLLNSLFTRVENIDFKPLVDTIKTKTGTARMKDFFIESSGLSTMELSLKILWFITKITIGRITRFPILNWFINPIMRGIIYWKGKMIQNGDPFETPCLKRPEGLQSLGTPLQRVWRGILNMPKTAFAKRSQNSASVEYANQIFGPRGKKNSALSNVDTLTKKQDIQLRKIAFIAIQSLLAIATRKQSFAVTHANSKRIGKSVKVYNLTLKEENAYYANGVLVQNCADAAFLSLFAARLRCGLSSNEKAAVVVRNRLQRSEFDLGFLTQKTQQPILPQNRILTLGGGWAQQI